MRSFVPLRAKPSTASAPGRAGNPMGRAFGRQWARIAAGLLLVALMAAHFHGAISLGLIDHVDRLGYDLRVRTGLTNAPDPRIAIVDIDEASLARLGRWPWGRDVVATLLHKLFDRYGAKIVGFDVVFAEPDNSSGLGTLDALGRADLKDDPAFLEALARLRPNLDHDGRFAAMLRGHPVVLGFYVSNHADARVHGVLPPPAALAGSFNPQAAKFLSWRGYNGNLQVFQDAASAGGHFNSIPDVDGISRRVPMLVEYRGNYYEALSLAVVRQLQGGASLRPIYQDTELGAGVGPLEALLVGNLRVPVDDKGTALIPFRGKRGSFNYFSAVDLFEDRLPEGGLANRIVLVGTSAPGLFDLRATPVESVFPGVEIHANLISGMLDQVVKASSDTRPLAESAFLIAAGVVLAVLLPFLSPTRSLLAAIGVAVTYLAYSIAAWSGWHNYVPTATVTLMIAGLLALNVLTGYFVETRARRHMAQLFGEYVPPELVNQMAEDPQKYSGEAKNEILTVLFADLRNFTAIAEGLDPTDLRRLLNEHFTEVSLVIHQYRGTVDKYLGDGVMAFWGAPLPDPDHARNAVRAGLALQDAVKRAAARLPFRVANALTIGVGINTGLASVGDMGSRLRREYTVLGDPVNLAARLESLTKYYSVGLVIGARTRELVPELVCRELDRVRVKGKEEAVSIYEPLGFEGEIEAGRLEELRIWTQMLRAYRAQDWDQAEVAIINLERRHGAAELYQLYSSRIANLRAHPPGPEWDGVTVFDRK
jgi:adenylate cyclase